MRAAIGKHNLAEVAMELRDKNGAKAAAENGIRAAEKAVAIKPDSGEFHRILGALCGQVIPASVISGLRYGKNIILADADSDGLHIATLLCGLFLRHFRPLVEAGKIYVAMPPLYRIDQGPKVFYALDEPEKNAILKRLSEDGKKGKINVQRFKGLGEMNPLQLRETTMHPETRRLVRLTLPQNDGSSGVIGDCKVAKKDVTSGIDSTRSNRSGRRTCSMASPPAAAASPAASTRSRSGATTRSTPPAASRGSRPGREE